MFSQDFTDIKSGESFDTEWTMKLIFRHYTVVLILSSLCILKCCKLFWLYPCFFLSHGPLTSTRKEIKYNFFIIILLYFSVRYFKTTKFLHLVHNEIRWHQDSTVLAAVCTAAHPPYARNDTWWHHFEFGLAFTTVRATGNKTFYRDGLWRIHKA